MWGSALLEGFNFYFRGIFAGAGGIFISGGGGGGGGLARGNIFMRFWAFPNIS